VTVEIKYAGDANATVTLCLLCRVPS